MNAEAVVALAVADLTGAANAAQGRRLALICGTEGWRIGYQTPPETLRGDWPVQAWLCEVDQPDQPVTFASLGEAATAASSMRILILFGFRHLRWWRRMRSEHWRTISGDVAGRQLAAIIAEEGVQPLCMSRRTQ